MFEKVKIIILCFILGMCIGFLIFVFSYNITEKQAKKYIIEHKDDIKWESNNVFRDGSKVHGFRINPCHKYYYDYITIKSNCKNNYFIIFWVKRDLWLNNFLTDKIISVDIPYNTYKNINTDIDKRIIKILKNKRLCLKK